MTREELIQKWLDNNLNPEEQKAFESLEDFEELLRLDKHLKSIQTPKFDSDEEFNTLKDVLHPIVNTRQLWPNKIIRIAAAIVLGFSLFYFVINQDTTVSTEIAQQFSVELPDNSSVKLNSNSILAYNKWFWNSNREVSLEGEAFFKVAKGQKFDVVTKDGTVSVLGTEFNVKQRHGIFDVTCYEGKVAVVHKDTTVTLTQGDTFTLINGKQIVKKKVVMAQPAWLRGESVFYSTPLQLVLNELEQHYNVRVECRDTDSLRLFTGSFPNKNLDVALESISIALNLKYRKTGNTIIFFSE